MLSNAVRTSLRSVVHRVCDTEECLKGSDGLRKQTRVQVEGDHAEEYAVVQHLILKIDANAIGSLPGI